MGVSNAVSRHTDEYAGAGPGGLTRTAELCLASSSSRSVSIEASVRMSTQSRAYTMTHRTANNDAMRPAFWRTIGVLMGGIAPPILANIFQICV